MTSDPFLSPKPAGARALVVVGCMNFGGRTPEKDARAIVERALERGVRCFDTANAYGNGASEQILGRSLTNVSDVRVATKVGLLQQKGRFEGLAPERIHAAVAESLERLGRPSVDLLYLHAPDRRVPLAESYAAVVELVGRGVVKHVGVSNYAAWELVELIAVCDAKGWPRPRVSQVLFNAAIRQVEVEYTRFAAKYGLHTTVYNPLAGGLLARPLDRSAPPPPGSRFDAQKRYRERYWTERLFHFAAGLQELAAASGLGVADLAYGWLARHPSVDSILAGPATVAHLDAAVDAVARDLPAESLTNVSELQRVFDGTDARYAR